jgi:hypothetical protein
MDVDSARDIDGWPYVIGVPCGFGGEENIVADEVLLLATNPAWASRLRWR